MQKLTMLLMLSVTTPAVPAVPTTQSCNVTVSVIDFDPAGVNVRVTRGGSIARTLKLKDPDDWFEVHVTGQDGDWFRIDRAEEVGDGRQEMWHGQGFMHRSVLGALGLVHGEPIYDRPDAAGRRILANQDGDQRIDLVSCRDDFMQIRTKGGRGWTQRLCLNQRTTCA